MITETTDTMAPRVAAVPPRAEHEAPPAFVVDPRVLQLLDIDVNRLAVPRVGKVQARPGADVPLVVLGPDGEEVVFLTRALRMLNGESIGPSTLRAYAKGFLRAARPMWAIGASPETLTVTEYAVVRAWLRTCLKRTSRVPGDAAGPLKATTLQLTQAGLGSVYSAARRGGLIATDPVATYRASDGPDDALTGTVRFDTDPARPRRSRNSQMAKPERREILVLSVEDRRRLRSARRPRDRAMWTLCLDSGPRISEVLSLTPATYFPDENYGMVVGKGLDGARRMIPITDATVRAIDAYLRFLAELGYVHGPDDPLFRSRTDLTVPLSYDASWKALRRLLGTSRVHPHALRHTAATELISLGKEPAAKRLLRVMDTLGHGSVATTQKYLHSDKTKQIAAHLAARATRLKPSEPLLRTTYGAGEMALLDLITQETHP